MRYVDTCVNIKCVLQTSYSLRSFSGICGRKASHLRIRIMKRLNVNTLFNVP